MRHLLPLLFSTSRKATFALLFLTLVSACGPAPQTLSAQDAALRERADRLARETIITDGHVDLPYRLRILNFRLEREFLPIPVQSDKGDFDYVRARKGGLDAPFMSIYIPASYQETGGALALADSLIDMVKGIAVAHPDKFRIAYHPDDLERNFKEGILSLPMGMENGAPIEDKIERVAYWKARGISYVTLTHSKDNLICDSSYDTTATHGGLSDFGREVVLEMNRTGIMVDISHVSDSTFWQVMDLTDVPCIASHSSVRKFTPGFERNMGDDMIRRLGEENGIIMINFGSTFLDGALQKRQDSLGNVYREEVEAAGIAEDDEAGREAFLEAFKARHPYLYSDVEKVADHIDHVVSLAGVKSVGFGSDFDGVGDSLPTGLKDVADYPNLVFTLLKRGYSEEEVKMMCSGNLLRVWRAVVGSK